MNDPFIRLYSGKKFRFLHPTVAEIDINDIAHSLSRIVRYTGHCHKDLTVAEHCVRCCDVAPLEYRLIVLMHDSTESLCGDLNSPLKDLLPQYQEMEDRIARLIARKYRLPYPFPAIVREIDKRMLVTEMHSLLAGNDYKSYPFVPYDFKIVPWSMDKAEREFLKRFNKYFVARGAKKD